MIITFEKAYLKQLYEEGKTNDKKHRFQPHIIERYQKVINFLRRAATIEELWQFKNLRYEVLKGDKNGISAVSINMQYRVEFIVAYTQDEPVLTICNILEISNHYK